MNPQTLMRYFVLKVRSPQIDLVIMVVPPSPRVCEIVRPEFVLCLFALDCRNTRAHPN
jgi:hypothetical protein